ncbi:P-loop containing nucleoside triphosphate hydrolase protein, partial [Eremomyces bilateralis CBS 781.70]
MAEMAKQKEKELVNPTGTRGKLIVIEGLDRAGKSTQAEMLVKSLKEEIGEDRVTHMRFPNRETATGQLINQYLSGAAEQHDHVIHLLFSANRWEFADAIERLITSGTTIVIDRYIYSGAVYSAAKLNPSLPLSWAAAPDIGLPRPDLCLFLDLSTAEAQARGGYGGERYERREMQERVRAGFK